MKKILLFIICCVITAISFAQKQTFDLITFTPPKGWIKNIDGTVLTFTKVDNKKNTYCRILILKSTISKGTIDADFDNEWQELVVKNYNPSAERKDNEVQEADGWKIKAGSSKFTFANKESMAMLTTASGYDRCASIVAITDNKDYIKDIQSLIASVNLIKPEAPSTQTTVVNAGDNSILGTWVRSASNQSNYAMNNGISGNIKNQYTFNADGTYTFYTKTFQYTFNKLLLTRESGTYKVEGENITITPKKSVIEAWSKKDGTDKWGELISTQKNSLENITYGFFKHFSPGMQKWYLVMEFFKPTQRDGPYNGGTLFKNAWMYGFEDYPIELP